MRMIKARPTMSGSLIKHRAYLKVTKRTTTDITKNIDKNKIILLKFVTKLRQEILVTEENGLQIFRGE